MDSLDKRDKKMRKISKEIISQQFNDRKDFGIENHFLSELINQIVRDQADKIKDFADFIFDFSKENQITQFDDRHSVQCEVHLLSEDKDVFSIHDETIYGPNLQHIIVINDKKKGDFHIRKLKNKDAIKEYKNKDYEVPGESFVTPGFIMTYHYYPEFLRRIISYVDMSNLEDKEKENFERIKKIESMGDNTYHLYECVDYSTSLMSLVKRDIQSGKYGK